MIVELLTQPLWRDEAFSALLALNPPLKIIKLVANDFGPPLFYLILHYWIKLFGISETSLRLLPFIFHLLNIFFVYLLGNYVASKLNIHRRSFAAAASLLTAVNPLLLYYGFEVRGYSLLAALSTASIYFFLRKRKLGYIVSSTLALYTHYYFVFLIFAQIVYLIRTRELSQNLYIAIPWLLFFPWLPAAAEQLTASAESWYYPVNLRQWQASLGGLFLNFSGAPVWFWRFAKLATLLLLLLAFYISVKYKDRIVDFILLWSLLPSISILFISIFRPVWVNRYLIFSAAGLTLIIALFIFTFSKRLRFALIAAALAGLFFYDNLFVRYKRKMDYRAPLTSLKPNLQENDLVVTDNALNLFEARYYLLNSSTPVKLYNPTNEHIPRYIGTAIIDDRDIIDKLPHDRQIYFLTLDGQVKKISAPASN